MDQEFEYILVTDGLSKRFGNFIAIDELNLQIQRNSTTSIIGPNGAGKTTLMNLLTGTIRPTDGRIYFKGSDITGKDPHDIVNMGIARSYQISNFFPEFTTLENLRIAAQAKFEGLAHRKYTSHYEAIDRAKEEAYRTLEEIGLEEVSGRVAGELSHGEQRLLEIGVAMASEPELLLLDEPTAGMSPDETVLISDLISDIDCTVVLVEHDMNIVMNISDEVIVMNLGSSIAQGTPDEIRANETVQKTYLKSSI